MQKSYKIEVDCANCANQVEEAINKMDEVKSCSINFMFQKMTLEFEDSIKEKDLLKQVKKVAKRIEPDFEVE